MKKFISETVENPLGKLTNKIVFNTNWYTVGLHVYESDSDYDDIDSSQAMLRYSPENIERCIKTKSEESSKWDSSNEKETHYSSPENKSSRPERRHSSKDKEHHLSKDNAKRHSKTHSHSPSDRHHHHRHHHRKHTHHSPSRRRDKR